jgi:hypothetical protein
MEIAGRFRLQVIEDSGHRPGRKAGDNARVSEPPDHVKRWDIFCRVVDNYGDAGVCWHTCSARTSMAIAR